MHALRASAVFDGERFLTGGATVLLEDGRIVGVESRGFTPPADVPVTAYDGTLLPGLVDAHVHLVSDASPGSLERSETRDDDDLDALVRQSLRQHARSGTTTVRDLGDRRYRTLSARDAAEPGLPRIVAAGPPLTVPDGHCHYLGGVVADAREIRAAVAEHADRGTDLVKVMASGGMLTTGTDVMGVQFSAEDLATVVSAAHDHGLAVTAHAHSLAGAWHALRAGADGIEHFTCLTERGEQTPDDLLAALAEAGTVVCPTLGWDRDRLPSPDQMSVQMRTVMARLGLDFDSMRRMRAAQMARVRAHGIPVITGVDAGAGPAKPHGIAWRSALALLEAGFSLAEALATATSAAADECGLGEVTGRLRAGLAADLLVVDGDLARDPEALGRPLAVLVRGCHTTP